MSKTIHGLAIALSVLLYAAVVYFVHPPINISSLAFWGMLLFGIALFILLGPFWTGTKNEEKLLDYKPFVISLSVFGVVLVVLLGSAIIASPLFSAGTLASKISPTTTTFQEQEDKFNINNIPLMDTDSARLFGSREVGSLSDVVSQYTISGAYSQIDYNGVPIKVSALTNPDIWRWYSNLQRGTIGYVKVDPVQQNAEYVPLPEDQGMIYVPTASFNNELSRHLWFQFPTKVIGASHFELDNSGNPYYITPCYSFSAGFFGGTDVSGIIITEPHTGDSNYYDVADVPSWVDNVYSGDLISAQYNMYGKYQNGFWNSLFSKTGCTKTGGDYGYVDINGEIWIYTGITSLNSDSSNIGFLLTSQRTKESYYIPMASADESSAMNAAEGQVQQMKYEASFPSLVSIDGQATYVMVLKDSSGIVKMYAMVNAASYNVVYDATTLTDCLTGYENAMTNAKINYTKDNVDMPDTDSGDSSSQAVGSSVQTAAQISVSFTVTGIKYVDISGNTWVYLTADNGNIYKQEFSNNEKLITLQNGSIIDCTAIDNGNGIFTILKMN